MSGISYRSGSGSRNKVTLSHTEVFPLSNEFPVGEEYLFPSFDKAGQPPADLKYRVKADKAEVQINDLPGTSHPPKIQIHPSLNRPMTVETLLGTAKEELRCVYKALKFLKCFKGVENLLKPEVKHIGFYVYDLKTPCDKYKPYQKGPYVCCGGPEFEVSTISRDCWCYGEGCPGLDSPEGKSKVSAFPFPGRQFQHTGRHLGFYYGHDSEELTRQTEKRQQTTYRVRKECAQYAELDAQEGKSTDPSDYFYVDDSPPRREKLSLHEEALRNRSSNTNQ